MKKISTCLVFMAIFIFTFGLAMSNVSFAQSQVKDHAVSKGNANVHSSSGAVYTVDYKGYTWLSTPGSAGSGDYNTWAFASSDSNVGFTVEAMDDTNLGLMEEGKQYTYYNPGTGGAVISDDIAASGESFVPPYTADPWYIVFFNWAPVKETAKITIAGTLNGPTTLTAISSNPYELTLTKESSGHIALNWSAPGTYEPYQIVPVDSYNIYRGTSSNHETFYATSYDTLSSTASFVDTNVVNGTSYYYYVTAVNTNGESIASNEVTDAPPTSITLILILVFCIVGGIVAAIAIGVTVSKKRRNAGQTIQPRVQKGYSPPGQAPYQPANLGTATGYSPPGQAPYQPANLGTATGSSPTGQAPHKPSNIGLTTQKTITFCTSCGANVKPGTKFCGSCGAKIEGQNFTGPAGLK